MSGRIVERDDVMRRVLWVSAVFNLSGAALFAFPSSAFGQLAGLPTPVPPLYCALVAFFVVLFGGAYAWLACQSRLNRPLVALAAIGKAGAFMLIFIFWLLDRLPGRGLLIAIVDLILAAIFMWWLFGVQQSRGVHDSAAA